MFNSDPVAAVLLKCKQLALRCFKLLLVFLSVSHPHSAGKGKENRFPFVTLLLTVLASAVLIVVIIAALYGLLNGLLS
ncbi:hypothetical protein [Aliamphritea spongicola]|uniref:hypothetical protein n=1 Tax=Aliamphritea spongicola TaxID=707589 RepID=UPI00196A998D|nr:hypothetical protein [Aliamphritea spongicola]MBN3564753.1 hypothetical protein [Aliamphritea spongicola]